MSIALVEVQVLFTAPLGINEKIVAQPSDFSYKSNFYNTMICTFLLH